MEPGTADPPGNSQCCDGHCSHVPQIHQTGGQAGNTRLFLTQEEREPHSAGEKKPVSQGNKGSESLGKVWQGHPREFKMPFLRAHTSLQKLTHYWQAPVIINCECNLIKSNKLSPSLSYLNCPSQGRAQRRDANRHLSLPTAHSQTVLMGGAEGEWLCLQMTLWNHHTSNQLLPGPRNEISHILHSPNRMSRKASILW